MTNTIFDKAGYLQDKVHQFTIAEFIGSFCSPATLISSTDSRSVRQTYVKSFHSLCTWAERVGASSILIGGSFITSTSCPNDMDVLVVFAKASEIRSPSEAPKDQTASIDIQCISEDEPELLQAFMQLIGADRRYIGRGLVQVKLHPNVTTLEKSEVKSPMLSVAMLTYLNRRNSVRADPSRLVIPIHGIRSDAAWVPRFTFLASAAGWTVAPFYYGFEAGSILGNESKKAAVVNDFRLWLDEIRKTFNGSISVVAHSFGSYIFGRYLQTAGDLVETFGGVVLAGSILNPNYNWTPILSTEVVSMVLNTRSANDEWVKMLPDGGIPVLARDPLMGKAAVEGFQITHDRLIEKQSNLLSHTNMFESDVIQRLWLPFLDRAERLIPLV